MTTTLSFQAGLSMEAAAARRDAEAARSELAVAQQTIGKLRTVVAERDALRDRVSSLERDLEAAHADAVRHARAASDEGAARSRKLAEEVVDLKRRAHDAEVQLQQV